MQRIKRKGCKWFSLIGILFFFFLFSCQELAQEGNIIWDAGWTLGLLAKSLILGIPVGSVLCLLLLKWEEKLENRKPGETRWNRTCSGKKTFFLSWLVMTVCWFPAWLAYYPGICSYDTSIQMGQILDKTYNTHHPLAHTLFLGAFVNLGKLLGDGTLGVGIHTFLQMLCLSAAMAAVIALLAGWKARFWMLAVVTVYCAVFPVNWYMGVTTTKDTVFSIFVLLFFFLFYAISEHAGCFGKRWHIGLVATTIGLILFRNNGKYALLVLWVFLGLTVFIGRKKEIRQLKWLFVDITIGLLLGSILMSGLAKALNAQEGDKREMLSMPIQQMARTMIYHGGVGVMPEDDNSLSEDDKALVNQFFTNEGYKEYRPDISDPVKRNTYTHVVRYQTVEFIKSYLNMLVHYPGDYVNAVIAVNAGFLSPLDVSHATINYNGRDIGLGYIQTRWTNEELNRAGIYKDSKWSLLWEKLETFAHENTYLDIPILRYLVAPGIYFWCYLLMAAWLYIHKRYKQLLPLAFVLGYYATLFLGPTVQLRYLYPLMIALPFWLIYVGITNKKETGES